MDNQTEGGTLILSGPDSDSESDVPEPLEMEEYVETNYIYSAEDEFGAVILNFSKRLFQGRVKLIVFLLGW